MRAKIRFAASGLVALLALAPVMSYASNGGQSNVPLEDRVRQEIAKIPYYNVFDTISFRVDDGTVTLFGEVTQPVVKDDAGSAVRHIEGVRAVKNEIEVLPLSPFDNQIRRAEYRAIFGYGPLQRYSMGVVPSIHIIVKNGQVTLEGVVSSEQDKQLAFMRANGVANVFSVQNNLRVQS